MWRYRVFLFIFFSFIVYISVGQEFSTDDQYKQAMANAKMAFEAKQYSQAVMFYRDAQQIKPKELLPRYKIEDIRTIYIKEELDSLKAVPVVATTQPIKKSKKEMEVADQQIKEMVEQQATEKMYNDADQVKKEISALVITAEVLQIDDSPTIDDAAVVNDIAPDREVAINTIETRNAQQIDHKPIEKEQGLTLSKQEIPEINKTTDSVVPEKKPENKPVIVKQKPEVVQTVSEPKEKSKEWIVRENDRLAKIYPNMKTVEEIDQPGKHITRVIMNINNEVTIYLKVKHDWGATFFFINEIGLDPVSISETYFNLKTKIATYEH